jgi:hypothetical protein
VGVSIFWGAGVGEREFYGIMFFECVGAAGPVFSGIDYSFGGGLAWSL